MPKERLTEAFVEGATCPPGKKDRLIFDRDLPGFGLRITTSGAKTFLAQYAYGGKKRRVPLGAFGMVTPDKARRQAKTILGQAAAGRDPYGERKAEAAATLEKERAEKEAAAAAAYTFKNLISDWRDARTGVKRESYLTEAAAALKRHFTTWLDRPASEITKTDAVRELDRIKREAGGTTANRCLSYARAAYNWSVRRDALPMNPFFNVAAPSGEKPRDRVLTEAELRAIWLAAPSAGEPYGDFIRVLLLTMARLSEVALMTWSEISADCGTWTLPKERSKNKKAHVFHLAEPVAAILKARPRLKDCPYVFAAASGRPITAFGHAKARLQAAMAAAQAEDETRALPLDWVLHDFRRAGVTALAGMGFAPHVCDRILNHVTGSIQGVAAVYQRAEFLPERKAALMAWAAHVIAASDGKAPADNVVALRA